ncbi:farnesyl pyrophosphate synthase isoform X2 [Adelges cooleyi]|uniref:farnesyl pyrophosphate synthase isoform X2 n=1 Tax=Adelges cooleyi TaxID=133065 RepID=UPI00217F32AF|nr:farnesyl pyrophosphate synthase isoform X2 [Adelges cooleyi]
MNNIKLALTKAISRRSILYHCDQIYYKNASKGCQFGSLVRPPKVPPAIVGTAVSKDDSREFMAVFPDVVRDLTDTGRHLDIPDVTKWLAKVLQYNVPGGKKNRGMALILSYRMLSDQAELTNENIRLSFILGWCIEILQAFLLVMDDIMDNAITRRGRPCWYRHNDIGLVAINDGILLEQGLYQIIKKYFRDKPYYCYILELFHDVTLKTSLGQSLDMLTANNFKTNKLEKFTMENYTAIVKYKTAYYSFYLPVCLAMHMANINDPEVFRQAKTILLEMGHFFQVQDDFLDCYGDPEVMGKIGTDIEDGKCSWLVVVALQKSNAQQKQILEENYGINDPAKIAIIKNLYDELKLPKTFQLYEDESYNMICTHIQQVSRGLSQDLFFKLLEKIYKRVL